MSKNKVVSKLEKLRRKHLSVYTQDVTIIEELMVYTHNHFKKVTTLSLPDLQSKEEQQILDWEEYKTIETTTSASIFEILKEHLVPLNFPIQKGISQTDYYRESTLKGKKLNTVAEASGLPLKNLKGIHLLFVGEHGRKVPALLITSATDFTSVVQALVYKNEPVLIPDAMGAIMIEGLNNWGRLRKNIQKIENFNPSLNRKEVLKRILKDKSLYQDRLMLISKKEYSNITPSGIGKIPWQEASIKIRLQHEYAHYFTKRYLGSMRNNMHDELIADYMGIHSIRPLFDAALFLHFIGLENASFYRKGGRLENYLGNPRLSPGAVIVLQKLLVKAAYNVELFDKSLGVKKNKTNLFSRVLVLAAFSLVEIASSNAGTLLIEQYIRNLSASQK